MEEVEVEVWNIHDAYMPKQYSIQGYSNSWKVCRCGRTTNYRDNYCPGCGQKLGFPEPEEKDDQ